MPAMPGTFWVPLRRSRSWPPPRARGSIVTPSRTTSTPPPCGPPNLWAETVMRSAGRQTSATFVPGGHLVFAIVAEFDPIKKVWLDAVNPR